MYPALRKLLADGQPVELGARAFDVLNALIERRDRLVTKEELLDLVWPGLVVEENNLQVQVSGLRKILGPNVIATVSGRGYHFASEVSARSAEWERLAAVGKHNLPQPTTSFIGRSRESAEVRGLLASTRLLTLVGAGGIGKTRQALQVAADVASSYGDGVWFVDLASIVDAELVPRTVASVLGTDLGNAQVPLEVLVRRLKSLEFLLVLDNCEHLIDAVAAFVQRLLAVATDLRVLATSREPLAIAGEQVFRLPSLTLPQDAPIGAEEALAAAAVELFVERAKAGNAHFAIDDKNAGSIARICRRLDGIPLAIEMAAARTPDLGIMDLEQKLDERFRLLAIGRRTAIPRQQTLRATLDWSHDLLRQEERVLLRRFAVFRGGFTLDAASSVGADDHIDELAVVSMLAHLVSCSLVAVEMDVVGARYRLLETTHAYATDKLTAAGETDVLRRRHAQYFCGHFERAFDDWLRIPDVDWEAAYLPEHDNIRAALSWAFGCGCEPELGIVLAGVSGMVWAIGPHRNEGRQRLEDAVARIGPHTPERRQAALWYSLGGLCDPELPPRGATAYGRAVDLFRRLGEPVLLGCSLVQLSKYLAKGARFEEAALALAEALPLLQGAGSRKPLAFYYWVKGHISALTGELSDAREQFEHALSLYRATAAERGTLQSLNAFADVTWALGDLDAALVGFRECVALARKSTLVDKSPLAYPLTNLAGVYTERGQLEEALITAREALVLLKQLGATGLYIDHLALRAALVGKLPIAARIAGYADAAFATREMQRQPNEARVREKLQVLLSDRLAPEELARLLVEGSNMGADEICRIALED